MARQKGVSTLTPLTLNQLTAAMSKYPDTPIQVGKGCIAALEKTLGVSFGLPKDEDSAPVAAVDNAPSPVAQVD